MTHRKPDIDRVWQPLFFQYEKTQFATGSSVFYTEQDAIGLQIESIQYFKIHQINFYSNFWINSQNSRPLILTHHYHHLDFDALATGIIPISLLETAQTAIQKNRLFFGGGITKFPVPQIFKVKDESQNIVADFDFHFNQYYGVNAADAFVYLAGTTQAQWVLTLMGEYSLK